MTSKVTQIGENAEKQTIRNCRFAYKCTKQWTDLTKTDSVIDNVRHCDDCQQSVYLCWTDAQLAKAIRLDRCVAIVTPIARAKRAAKGRKSLSSRALVGLPRPPPYE